MRRDIERRLWSGARRSAQVAGPMRRLGATLALAAGLALFQGAGAAQDPPRFCFDPIKSHPIRGLSEAETREFTARITKMHEFLGSHPDVNAPRPPECTYIYTNTELNSNVVAGAVAASSVIGFMTSAPGRPCPKVDNTSIVFRINDVNKIYNCSMEVGSDRYCTVPDLRPAPGGFLQARNRTTFFLLLRSREPLLVPVSKEGYLRAWEQEYGRKLAAKDVEEDYGRRQLERVRAALSALPAEKRRMQACWPLPEAGKEWLQWDPGPGECAPGTGLGKPNPNIVRSTPSPADIESVLVSTVTGRTVGVSVEAHEHKERVLRNLDFEGLARVLMK